MNRTTNQPFIVNLVVALPCEARPLIEFYKLKKVTQTRETFSIFCNSEKTIYLIISGLGKLKAAIATTYLHFFSGQNASSTFLNIGLAGSDCIAIGSCVLISKITDSMISRNWYPHVSLLKGLDMMPLITTDILLASYPKRALLDMEGAGFFQAAHSFVSLEHIQIIKIVSDGDSETRDSLTKEKAYRLIFAGLNQIDTVVNYLINLSTKEMKTHQKGDLSLFIQKWHFTQSHQYKLCEVLRRWNCYFPDTSAFDFCVSQNNAKEVIHLLEKEINRYVSVH